MRPTPHRIVRAIAAIGPLLFVAVATVEGASRPGYDAIAEPISALAVGGRGWIQAINFIVLAVSFVATAVLLRSELRAGAAARAVPVVFLVIASGLVWAALFPMDAPGAPATRSGELHVVGGLLVFPLIPVVTLLAARAFRGDPTWRSYAAYTRVTGLFCLAAVVFFVLFVGPPGADRPFGAIRGLAQRVMLFPFFTWVTLLACRPMNEPEVDGRARSEPERRLERGARGGLGKPRLG